mmetsp:Transcript_25766/g.38984  ORF Transcript_25766/g.38984 Transcript_25766/m.38984 type:complete len:308 (+) Transcript_25766:231-1154(+)
MTIITTKVVQSLGTEGGLAVIDLPDSKVALHKSCFETARQAFSSAEKGGVSCLIQPEDDSAHVTGYHAASEEMSRYNVYRKGFIFSDGNNDIISVKGVSNFRADMSAFFDSLHNDIALAVLAQMESEWSLPANWFQDLLGPTNRNSQWHIKQYVPTTNGDDIWLPLHTDPSLISIVVHDAPGKRAGAIGLQYQSPSQSYDWVDVPFHGHRVATILVGSVLSYLTGGRVPAARHRVVVTANDNPRVVATLFVRPKGSAALLVPPSPLFEGVVLKKTQITFAQWSSRVARNYTKKKKNKTKTSPSESYS